MMRECLSVLAVLFMGVTAATLPGARAEQPPVTEPGAEQLRWDLSQPEFNPPSCPAWAKVQTPAWVERYKGKNGAPEPYHSQKRPMGSSTEGIDRYQANQFVNHLPQTAEFIYTQYTPLEAGYMRGTLPMYEKIVAQYTTEDMTDTEKALALLHNAMPDRFRHPSMPPLGKKVAADRNLMDEELLATGSGWCNEQARVFIRLCQVAGMQGRMIHLFGQNHTIAEFYADGQWVMADASNMFVARDTNGKLLSAAECHDGAAGQRAYALAKKARLMEMRNTPPKELGISPDETEKYQNSWERFDAEKLAERDDLHFGVINYPLPVSTWSE